VPLLNTRALQIESNAIKILSNSLFKYPFIQSKYIERHLPSSNGLSKFKSSLPKPTHLTTLFNNKQFHTLFHSSTSTLHSFPFPLLTLHLFLLFSLTKYLLILMQSQITFQKNQTSSNRNQHFLFCVTTLN